MEFLQTSTRNLLDAEAKAGVGHHVALSDVGPERLSESGYFRAKQAQEGRAVARISVGSPTNGTVEVAGPERFRLDELIRRYLVARHDPRDVVADHEARYFGARLGERTLLPGDDAILLKDSFEDWLDLAATQIR